MNLTRALLRATDAAISAAPRIGHAGKIHEMPSGLRVLGVSRSWAETVDKTLANILDASPDLRHVVIRVPKADRDVRRLFHSEDGVTWCQVHPSDFGTRKLDFGMVQRGAQELDGDPAFTTELTFPNLLLRQLVGDLLMPRTRFEGRKAVHSSLAEWVESALRPVLDAAAEIYVSGPKSEEARNGRRHSLVTIERHIRHLRHSLPFEERFEFPEKYPDADAWLLGALKRFMIRRHVPFITKPEDLLWAFARLNKKKQELVAKGIWADAARMPREAHFDVVYGALLRQAEGHPIFGDKDYQKLEALLAEDLAAGHHVVRLDGRLFVRSQDRWRPARVAPVVKGEATWSRGKIVSRNFGRVIVPPHIVDGELVAGYTRNGPGEGPSPRRPQPVTMLCVDRPVPDTNLQWLHAYHAWELAQG